MPERRDYALNELWHGPIRYWAGLRAADMDGLYEISAFVSELGSDVEGGNVLAALAQGEMLAEVCAIVSKNRFTRDLNSQILRVRAELCGLLKREELRLGDRIKIGDLLAALGDPRLETPDLARVKSIPEGDRMIGRNQNHHTRIAKYRTCPAAPPIQGHLRAFGIASFLVTNGEFRRFLQGGWIFRSEVLAKQSRLEMGIWR